MIRYSVIVAQRNVGEAFALQMAQLARVMDFLDLPYEILCVDDGSALPTSRILLGLLDTYSQLRVLRFETPQGISAALAAAIAAAEGDIVISIEAGLQYNVEQIPHLISRLSRGDLIFGRRRHPRWVEVLRSIARVPRRMLVGQDVHDPDCQFWAARYEAVAGLELSRGMFRYLPVLVAMRGYRVSEITVEFTRSLPAMHDAWPNPGDLLNVWWQRRRKRHAQAQEIMLDDLDGRPRIKLARIDSAEMFHRSRSTRPQRQTGPQRLQ